jgi:predicted Zn-dependent peptidase
VCAIYSEAGIDFISIALPGGKNTKYYSRELFPALNRNQFTFAVMISLDRKSPPPIHDAVELDYVLPAINRQRLDNGIPFYWLSAGVQDVAEVDFVFPAGVWQEEKPAVASATGGLLKNGTSKRTAHQIHESLEFYGANLRVNTGDDFCIVSLYALTKDLPQLLPIVHEIITDAVFPEEEVIIHKQNAIQRLLVNLRQCEFVANQRIDALLWGEAHPYGRYSRVEKIEAITREDLLRFYKRAYAMGGAQIFMAGRINESDAALINSIFGKIAAAPAEEDEQHFSTAGPSHQKHREINDPNGVQSAIRIARLFPNRHHPDFPKMLVLNTLFGGYFGARLMSNIREDKGYTYGIYSSLQPNVRGGSLTIHTEVGRDVTEAAITEIYREMETLRQTPADNDELLLVKNYLLGGLLGDLDGPFQLLQRWRTLILNDLDEAHFNNNVRIYKGITATELQALAQQYFVPEDFYEIAVV